MVVNWSLVLLIALLILFVYLYWTNKISGKTLIIILLVIVILLLIIPAIVGASVIGIIANMCMDRQCNQVKLPFNIQNVGPLDKNWTMYRTNLGGNVAPTPNQML